MVINAVALKALVVSIAQALKTFVSNIAHIEDLGGDQRSIIEDLGERGLEPPMTGKYLLE